MRPDRDSGEATHWRKEMAMRRRRPFGRIKDEKIFRIEEVNGLRLLPSPGGRSSYSRDRIPLYRSSSSPS
jgi:hypothetical protein